MPLPLLSWTFGAIAATFSRLLSLRYKISSRSVRLSEPTRQLLAVWKGVSGPYAPVMGGKVLPFINTPLLSSLKRYVLLQL